MITLNATTSTILEHAQISFSWTDYILFVAMLLLSILVGVYFGFFKKQDTSDKYLFGGKQMGYFPVALSLTASHISGITLLGVPSEVYYYGSSYWATSICIIIVCVFVYYAFLPILLKINVTSSFEYLQMRFDKKIRYITSILFIVKSIAFLPVVVYIPALAFSQVTGVSVHMITPIVCFVCIFYTSVGGFKAVVWTDTFQFAITVATTFVILFLGVKYAGGIENIWRKSEEGGRLDFFNLDPSLSSRTTFWGYSIGLTASWIAELGVNQGMIQKYLSIPTMKGIRKSFFCFCTAFTLIKLVSVVTGLIMYAKYQFCDPLTSHAIKKPDQILPYFIMDVAGNVPGIPGLFVAAVFSTALSSMSASLNTLSGTLYDDVVSPFLSKEKKNEKYASYIMKICTVGVGIVSVSLVFVVERMGGLLPLVMAISGSLAGTMTGLFILAAFIPWANAKGVLVGSFTSMICTVMIMVGARYHIAVGDIVYPKLPLLTMGCSSNSSMILDSSMFNYTFPTSYDRRPIIKDNVFFLFKISYVYYTLLGTLIQITVSMIVSWITGFNDLKDVNPDLISPLCQFLLPKQPMSEKEKEQYKTVEESLEMLKKQEGA